jgi:multiple sugar transport system permease protein
MLAPFFLLFIVFTVLPVFLSILLSFTDFNMLQIPNWQGLNNYTRLFLEDEIFLLACKNTLVFACVTGPVSYLLSLLIAWFINELPPLPRSIVSFIFYSPVLVGNVYFIWTFIFSGDTYGSILGSVLWG